MTPRPKRSDEAILKAVIDKNAEPFLLYCETDQSNAEDVQSIKDDLFRCIEFERDAFQAAFDLQDLCHWDGSEELVDLCSQLLHQKYTAYQDAVRKWVNEGNTKKTKQLGDEVTITIKGQKVKGVIMSSRADLAEYIITVSEHNHRAKLGEGYIIPWEDVE